MPALRRIVLPAGSAIFAYVLYKAVSMPIDWASFRQIRWETLLLIILFCLSLPFFQMAQWKVLQQRLQDVSWASALNIILPTIYAGYFPLRGTQILLRMYVAKDQGIPYTTSAASLLTNFFWKWILILLSFPLLILILPVRFEVTVWVAPGVFILAVLAAYLLRNYLYRLLSIAVRRSFPSNANLDVAIHLRAVEEKVRLIVRSRAMLVYSAMFLGHSALGYYIMALLWRDLGWEILFVKLMAIGFAAAAVGWFSQLPAGIGAQEASYAYLLSLIGPPLQLALIVGFIWRFITTVIDLSVSAGSFALIWLVRRPAKRASVPEKGKGL